MADSVSSNTSLSWLIDPLESTRDAAEGAYQFAGDRRAWLVPLILGFALITISAMGGWQNPDDFFFAYLAGWSFLLTTALGGLLFLIFHHLTRASWSVVVNRINETLVWAFPLLFVLGLPLLFGMHDLYHWTHPELYDPSSSHYDEILAGKRAYLNFPFWCARMVVYFLAWTIVSYRLYTFSVRQDVDPDPSIPAKLRSTSAWGLPLTAVTLAFASYDILMSLDPHWFSTIFGVYFFSGGILSAVAVITLVALLLQNLGGQLQNTITREHYQDLGKYMFGFVVFWAYIAFSQYMLYWYGGIPEETVWFQHRLQNGWGWHSAFLLGFHFVVPFLVLLPRAPKRSHMILSFMSVWVLVMHWFDMHWVVLPVLRESGGFHWLDITCWLGLAGIFGGILMYRLSRHPLVPQNHPFLSESLHFENA
ncbi:hypothetical protein BSZ35_14960 [Salinibacter sp. 10B]|uniref:hypothetical protein n=1 Tax=Salinibacter sp. 10B TaxID=1923971 RepID=UPI000CF4C7EA|nr:hypothetical protein [Salinibacter sp. 10B]PQJ35721.1 hypothetical protein BSZ35_14960 [Salinibacter sp. 10B]